MLYQCVSAYGSLFYIAFYLRDMVRLRETLATLLISRQVIQNIVEVGLPWLAERAKVSHLTMKLTRNMSDQSLREHVSRRKRERSEGPSCEEPPTLSPHATSLRYRGSLKEVNPSSRKSSSRLPIPEFNVASTTEITHAELEALMPKYISPLEDYLGLLLS